MPVPIDLDLRAGNRDQFHRIDLLCWIFWCTWAQELCQPIEIQSSKAQQSRFF